MWRASKITKVVAEAERDDELDRQANVHTSSELENIGNGINGYVVRSSYEEVARLKEARYSVRGQPWCKPALSTKGKRGEGVA